MWPVPVTVEDPGLHVGFGDLGPLSLGRGPKAKLRTLEIPNKSWLGNWIPIGFLFIQPPAAGRSLLLVIAIVIPQMGHNPHLMGRRTKAQKKFTQFGPNHTVGTWQSQGEFEPFASKSCTSRRCLSCGGQVLIFSYKSNSR